MPCPRSAARRMAGNLGAISGPLLVLVVTLIGQELGKDSCFD
ncbi:hypothetical protein OG709_01595 [Streptomyces sp. NBC_01267]|nr:MULTISPECIES: hypothetical protein [unclassified Streptomyces]MCX4552978.1 hypothetical protein [Streptomyces sp. NBC_01500]WSC24302.1 hypothetical protein OIE60_34030 [Streptomyces sp. NBC_01766]WSV58186.1 hypothetical protein OG282_33315 [Streptomyces sp. NBC_01014]